MQTMTQEYAKYIFQWMMDIIRIVVSSPHFEKLAYILLGAFVTVVLTYICQRLLIHEQYKMHKRLEEDKRKHESDELSNKLETRKKDIEDSIKSMTAHLIDKTNEYIAIGVTIPNNTSEPFVVRRVEFKVKNGGYYCPGFVPNEFRNNGRPAKKVDNNAVELPPFSDGNWIFPYEQNGCATSAMKNGAVVFEQCEVIVEYRTPKDDTLTMTIISDPSVCAGLTECAAQIVSSYKQNSIK